MLKKDSYYKRYDSMKYILFADDCSGPSHKFTYEVSKTKMFNVIQNCLLEFAIAVKERYVIDCV